MHLKKTLKRFILRLGMLRIRQWFLPQTAVILAYHSVSPNRQGQSVFINTGITTDQKLFDEHMHILRSKFNPVTLDEIVNWLQGSSLLPPRAVAVTFDDGFADNYSVAAPIMEKYDIRGTIYLTVNSVLKQQLPWFCRINYLFYSMKNKKLILPDPEDGKSWNLADPQEFKKAFSRFNNLCAKMTEEEMEAYLEQLESQFGFHFDFEQCPQMMSFEQARELRRRHHLIGNHTLSHGNVAHIPPQKVHEEIVGANAILEQELGEKVEHFSYPHPSLNPQYNEQTIEETKKFGFKSAVLTSFGTIFRDNSPFLLPRLMISNQDAAEFYWKLETALSGIQT